MPDETSEQLFSLSVDFERGTKNPGRVFLAMNQLIESFQSADRLLLKGFQVETEIKADLILQDITSGSLRTWILEKVHAALDSIPEETLRSGDYKKVLGEFAVKGKHKIAEYLANRQELPTHQELQQLSYEIHQVAQDEVGSGFPMYIAPTPKEVLVLLQEMARATHPLSGGDRVLFTSSAGEVVLQQELEISDQDVKRILTREEVINTNSFVLQVRRPDFLGGAQWEFRHLDQPLRAKIRDEEWLTRFHNREEVVLPGDALRVVMTSTISYGPDWQAIDQDHCIEKVLAVIGADRAPDLPML